MTGWSVEAGLEVFSYSLGLDPVLVPVDGGMHVFSIVWDK